MYVYVYTPVYLHTYVHNTYVHTHKHISWMVPTYTTIHILCIYMTIRYILCIHIKDY